MYNTYVVVCYACACGLLSWLSVRLRLLSWLSVRLRLLLWPRVRLLVLSAATNRIF